MYGAPVLAADLGAGAALVLAGMAAEGTTHMEGVSHVDRGHEKSDSPVASSRCINSEVALPTI
jgi:UDP-N-acetylglucosamine 1-carboxyvinyltransferase